jgi:hypothetical protein
MAFVLVGDRVCGRESLGLCFEKTMRSERTELGGSCWLFIATAPVPRVTFDGRKDNPVESRSRARRIAYNWRGTWKIAGNRIMDNVAVVTSTAIGGEFSELHCDTPK